MVINPMIGVYLPTIRIPYQGWENHPQYKEFRLWRILGGIQFDVLSTDRRFQAEPAFKIVTPSKSASTKLFSTSCICNAAFSLSSHSIASKDGVKLSKASKRSFSDREIAFQFGRYKTCVSVFQRVSAARTVKGLKKRAEAQSQPKPETYASASRFSPAAYNDDEGAGLNIDLADLIPIAYAVNLHVIRRKIDLSESYAQLKDVLAQPKTIMFASYFKRAFTRSLMISDMARCPDI